MSKHTLGPWRWEFNQSGKVLHLVGGKPMYDLTVMDFSRWGMGRAVATLRDTSEGGFNIMHRLCDRKDWIAPFPGREHHADWCADVTHPDMRLMAAAPDLLAALQELVPGIVTGSCDECGGIEQNYPTYCAYRKARAAIARATGEQA